MTPSPIMISRVQTGLKSRASPGDDDGSNTVTTMFSFLIIFIVVFAALVIGGIVWHHIVRRRRMRMFGALSPAGEQIWITVGANGLASAIGPRGDPLGPEIIPKLWEVWTADGHSTTEKQKQATWKTVQPLAVQVERPESSSLSSEKESVKPTRRGSTNPFQRLRQNSSLARSASGRKERPDQDADSETPPPDYANAVNVSVLVAMPSQNRNRAHNHHHEHEHKHGLGDGGKEQPPSQGLLDSRTLNGEYVIGTCRSLMPESTRL